MHLQLFSLVATLAGAGYLVGWLLCQVRVLFTKGLAVWPQRKMAGKVMFLKTWSKAGEGHGILISLAGALCGGLVTWWLSQVLVREWLLVIFVVLVALSDELQVSSKETRLLEVTIFFDRLLAQSAAGQELFEALAKILQELPPGDVQKGVREAVLRRLGRGDFATSIGAMRGFDPLLDECVLTLQLTGWQNGPATSMILNRLLRRAGRRWDRASRILLMKDRSQHYLQFGRGALISSMWVIMISGFASVAHFMPGRAVIAWSGLALLGLGLLFYLFIIHPWLRRFLVVSLFILTLVSFLNPSFIQMPLRVETISHSSEGIMGTGTVTNPIMTFRKLPAISIQAKPDFPYSYAGEAAFPVPTPAPTILPTRAITPSPVLPAFRVHEVLNPCCPRSYQRR